MVKTIELILGLPPMTQLDLSRDADARLLHRRARPDALRRGEEQDPARRDEQAGRRSSTGKAQEFALKSLELDFDDEDRADEDTLNRILWFSVRGDQPYPGDL